MQWVSGCKKVFPNLIQFLTIAVDCQNIYCAIIKQSAFYGSTNLGHFIVCNDWLIGNNFLISKPLSIESFLIKERCTLLTSDSTVISFYKAVR